MFITLFKKYLFALIVSSYVITVIGIPVYFHYCGGELEEISYLLKGNSCCDDEDTNEEATDNGCCKDENLVLKSNIDFTLKKFTTGDFVKTFSQLFFISLPFSTEPKVASGFYTAAFAESPPPGIQHTLVISTSVLRI